MAMIGQKTPVTRLNCFSPPVMAATFIIELALAFYTLVRYRRGRIVLLAVSLLVFLAVFQLAEYFVCGGLGASGMTWSRIGYVAITLLPALSVHLVGEIGRTKQRWVAYVVDAVAVGFAAYFAFASAAVNASLCAGNYVIFHLQQSSAWWYGAYYYGAILISLMLAAGYIEAAKSKERLAALRWFVVGVLAFLIPTAVVNGLDPKTIEGIPSIMCGFAVLYALVLALRIVPLVQKQST